MRSRVDAHIYTALQARIVFDRLRGVPHLTLNAIFVGLVPAVIAWLVEETLCAVCSGLEKKGGVPTNVAVPTFSPRKRFEKLFRYISQRQLHSFS